MLEVGLNLPKQNIYSTISALPYVLMVILQSVKGLRLLFIHLSYRTKAQWNEMMVLLSVLRLFQFYFCLYLLMQSISESQHNNITETFILFLIYTLLWQIDFTPTIRPFLQCWSNKVKMRSRLPQRQVLPSDILNLCN